MSFKTVMFVVHWGLLWAAVACGWLYAPVFVFRANEECSRDVCLVRFDRVTKLWLPLWEASDPVKVWEETPDYFLEPELRPPSFECDPSETGEGDPVEDMPTTKQIDYAFCVAECPDAREPKLERECRERCEQELGE